ncbi:hypothetical protein HanIR_Chr05g0251981 [Helianthus annuus]|nr:hypothetical protein HanIR_Chr05g0251981 [Helianthus annuus]
MSSKCFLTSSSSYKSLARVVLPNPPIPTNPRPIFSFSRSCNLVVIASVAGSSST